MDQLAELVLDYLMIYRVSARTSKKNHCLPLDGSFSLYPGMSKPDLYGMVDAVYILKIIGKLEETTTVQSREKWARRIITCQDNDGWFSRTNYKGHPSEHATAYAIGALKLLEVDSNKNYLSRIRPISTIKPLLLDRLVFYRWIKQMGFESIKDIPRKNVGWHYIWRGSHVGGGIAAIIGMTNHMFDKWWKDIPNIDEWFKWYFDWLDTNANPRTGLWQRAIWNYFYRKPTLIDLGGAAHFWWIYNARKHPFPYPEATLNSILSLQSPSGLYKDHPFCIDYDAINGLLQAYQQLPIEKKERKKNEVYQSIGKSYKAIENYLISHPLEKVYDDLHGLPGALMALVECKKLPNFAPAKKLTGWQNVFEKVWWL